jgi:glycosyltransferase involved in cell wall biosynthesis
VHLLHTELRQLGHHVEVFGAEGSGPGVEQLAPAIWSRDLGNPDHHIEWNRHFAYLALVAKRLQGHGFDVVHDHTRYPGILICQLSQAAPVNVHTMHEPIDESALGFLLELSKNVRLVALSAAQAASVPGLELAGVVHNAVDIDSLTIGAQGKGYLLLMGRIVSAKGQHLAIQVAYRTGRRLILAGKIQSQAYFDREVKPHLGAQIEHRPNVVGAEKQDLLAGADAGIFPLQWDEPFGLAMAECMASGTPVIALARGSAPELIDGGTTGYLAQDLEGLVAGVNRLVEIDRLNCAKAARRRFNPRRMAEDYLQVYTA